MRAGHASRTAEHNALFRALDSARPPDRRRIDDQHAARFLTWPLSLAYRIARLPGGGALVPWIIDRRWPGVRTSVVARTRLIDEVITRALATDRIAQLVILGAGLDSRAYRLPGLQGTAVFEVDHPDTQAGKQRALTRAFGALPAHVRYVAIDFARDDLGATMTAAGFDQAARSLILWEGVTNYLTADAVDTTLAWCARAAPGSVLLFTYVHRDILTRPETFAGSDRLRATLDKVGERFTFGIDPKELGAFLDRRGLTLESDVGAAEFRALCYGEDAARRMRGHEFYRVARARGQGG